ncbi:cupin domain-containing protein [Maridesulfovibrio sp. FT414]|uniref:cupin domain-containing protein n=1 Tax=Maridesulfovibrio sp. FT414 TaxID=2979469 RepID=UPI003D8060BE
MLGEEFATLMANGCVKTIDGSINCSDLEWNPHPAFAGVYLKHLVSGKNTGGNLSCHMVRIDPGCTLESHTHNPQWELHEVIKGSGQVVLDGEESAYHPGRSAVIPCGKQHSVVAGDNGLVLLAKFFPALI